MELARAFPNIAQQVCFHPKQSTFNLLMDWSLAANRKCPVAKKGPHAPSDDHPPPHHE